MKNEAFWAQSGLRCARDPQLGKLKSRKDFFIEALDASSKYKAENEKINLFINFPKLRFSSSNENLNFLILMYN